MFLIETGSRNLLFPEAVKFVSQFALILNTGLLLKQHQN